MTRWPLMILLLFLTGCFEDKEAVLAKCRLKYENEKNLSSYDISDSVRLCMSADGYEYTPLEEGCRSAGIHPYWDSDCYRQRSIFDNLR